MADLARYSHNYEEKNDYTIGFCNIPETPDPIACNVRGKIPSYVVGDLYRNGPGKYEVKRNDGSTARVAHWFDGLTLMHRFHISEDGSVTYNSRFLAAGLEEEIKKGNRGTGGWAPDPCQTVFQRFFAFWNTLKGGELRTRSVDGKPATNVGVTVGRWGDKIVSRTDVNLFLEVEKETLEPKELYSYPTVDPRFKGMLATSHTQYDHKRKETISVSLDLGKAATYTIAALPDNGKNYVVGEFTASLGSYIHSFGLTENHVIITAWPLYWKPLSLLWYGHPMSSMDWQGQTPTTVYIIRREDGKLVAKHEVASGFAFHHINAFESEGHIVADVFVYKDAEVLEKLYLKNIMDTSNMKLPAGNVRRYYLPLAEGEKAKSEDLYTGLFELARFNQLYHMKRYRYAYAVDVYGSEGVLGRICKLNLDTKETKFWGQEGYYSGEPIFIHDPNGKEEDDGVLLSVVLDVKSRASFLLILNARDMLEVARAELRTPVSFGFHGNFFGPKVAIDQ